MEKYRVNKNVLYQRDYRIPQDISVLDYIVNQNAEKEITDGESTVLVLSLNEEIYEVNLVGAIIFEMINNNYGIDDILIKLRNVFQVNEMDLHNCVDAFVQQMVQFGVLEVEK